jgi:ABC-type glycerol-3-phosphate transport system substrate-binding protein
LRKTALALASILIVAACGKPTATLSVTPSQLAPPDAFKCVMSGLQSLGFQRTMFDQDELRTSARKENPKITFSNTQFQKTWDRLDARVQAANTGTAIDITAFTEAEYFSQNGKNFERLSPSDEVRQAAEELQKRCAQASPATDDSVPQATQQ